MGCVQCGQLAQEQNSRWEELLREQDTFVLLQSEGPCPWQKADLTGAFPLLNPLATPFGKAQMSASEVRLEKLLKLLPWRARRALQEQGSSGQLMKRLSQSMPFSIGSNREDSNAAALCALQGCACHDQVESLVASVVLRQDGDGQSTRRICGFACTGNTQVLVIAASLLGTITATQTVGSIFAHSQALLTDSYAMWIDFFTYVLGIIAESVPRSFLRLVVPALSLSCLAYATSGSLQEALETISTGSSDDDDVKPWIVFFFSAWCLVFDAIAIVAFLKNSQKEASHINMIAAFAHVLADFVRSMATCVESVLIIYWHVDGALADAWATVAVSAAIFLGLIYPAMEWSKALYSALRGPKHNL